MVAHTNVASIWLVFTSERLRAPFELELAERGNDLVRDLSRSDLDLLRNSVPNKRVHRVVTELFEHKRSLGIVRTYMPVGERVEWGEQRRWWLGGSETASESRLAKDALTRDTADGKSHSDSELWPEVCASGVQDKERKKQRSMLYVNWCRPGSVEALS